MRALILVVAGAWLAWPRPACAQDEVGHTCVWGCDGAGDAGASSYDPAVEMTRREQAFQMQWANAQRAGAAERAAAARRANDQGLAAAKRHDWALALFFFRGAASLDPSGAEFARNASEAEARADEERRERAAAAGPVVPTYGGTPAQIAARMRGGMTPAMPGAWSYLDGAFSLLAGDASDAVADGSVELESATPYGMFLRVQANVLKLTRAVPDGILRAARGELSPDEASSLDLRGSTIVLNMGAAPGRYLEKLVEVRSGTVAALDLAEAKTTASLQHGLEWLVGGASEEAARAVVVAKDLPRVIALWAPAPASQP